MSTIPDAADPKKLGYVGKTPGTSSRDSNAWFTPPKYLDAVRAALGGAIHLDPFSSDEANKKVQAEQFFTATDDAFSQDWSVQKDGSSYARKAGARRAVFMNPPYSGKLCSQAVTRFLDEFAAGSFSEGIILVNNATETKWFQRALQECAAVCFTGHRISFWNADGKAQSGNTRGQAFLYFWGECRRLSEQFCDRSGW
jgi:phage N-6-adenine-methyltransferase